MGAIHPARGLGGANRDHLPGEIPLANGAGGIQPLIALQPDETTAKGKAERLGDLGLASARPALEEKRAPQRQRQVGHGARRAPAHITLRAEHVLHRAVKDAH